MSRKTKAARAKRPTIKDREQTAYLRGYGVGSEDQQKIQGFAAERAAEQAAAERARAPRRHFWVEQNESGFTLTECTAGSVRGKSWTFPSARQCGEQVDSLIG